jgi:PLP dependent protein
MNNISQRINTIKKAIKKVALKADRDPETITLLAVSKRHPVESINDAIAGGQLDFGENYGQELRDKAAIVQYNINWHYIGPIQKNKLKYIVGISSLIHTVSSEKIVDAIQNRAENLGIIQNILVQIKTSEEESKHGLPPHELGNFLEYISKKPNIKCLGLMTMPPFFLEPEQTLPYFRQLKELKESFSDCKFPNIEMHHLSMGMTSDFEVAISQGATIVRIGTAIFGERPLAV